MWPFAALFLNVLLIFMCRH
jgi:hypothetical protein